MLSLTGNTVIPYKESENIPSSSYVSEGKTIRFLQFIICADNSLWLCVNSNDQQNLHWKLISQEQ